MIAPLVSVICIFLDEERFLAEAVESVLAQDYPNFELLLVDDGSSDGSVALARDYARRLPHAVRYFDHDGHVNHGMSATRNLGLLHAHGEFVAFIDADDRWRPNKLRDQVALFEDRPSVGIVCGRVNYWSSWEGGNDRLVDTGGPVPGTSRPPATTLALYPLGWANAPCPSDVMIRKSVAQAVGGFEEHFIGPLQMYEDQAFFAKAYLATDVYFSDRTWLDYRLHAESCMAGVQQSGRYPEVRQYFLNWFAGYLQPREFQGKSAVLRKLRAAKFALAHPTTAHLWQRLQSFLGRLAGWWVDAWGSEVGPPALQTLRRSGPQVDQSRDDRDTVPAGMVSTRKS